MSTLIDLINLVNAQQAQIAALQHENAQLKAVVEQRRAEPTTPSHAVQAHTGNGQAVTVSLREGK